MEAAQLRRLATEGFAATRGERLSDLAVWCRDIGEASGDARYSSIGEVLRSINDWWAEHDEAGGVPASIVRRLEGLLASYLPDILDLDSPADASPLARLLREETQCLLLAPRDWGPYLDDLPETRSGNDELAPPG